MAPIVGFFIVGLLAGGLLSFSYTNHRWSSDFWVLQSEFDRLLGAFDEARRDRDRLAATIQRMKTTARGKLVLRIVFAGLPVDTIWDLAEELAELLSLKEVFEELGLEYLQPPDNRDSDTTTIWARVSVRITWVQGLFRFNRGEPKQIKAQDNPS